MCLPRHVDGMDGWCGVDGLGMDGMGLLLTERTPGFPETTRVQFTVRFTRYLLAIGVFTDTLVGVRPVVRPTTHNYCVWDAACCSAGRATPSDVMLCALPPPDLVRWGGQAHGGRLLACLLCAAIVSWCQKQDIQTASKPQAPSGLGGAARAAAASRRRGFVSCHLACSVLCEG
jgi:hypothetical protein